MEWRERITEWIIEHATWELATRLGVAAISGAAVSLGIPSIRRLPLLEVVICSLLVFALVLGAFNKLFGWRLLSEIRFDYLPKSPLENGWRIGYREPGPNARWSRPADAPVPGCISIEMAHDCAIETNVVPNATVATRLAFSAKYTTTTMLFVMVEVSSIDGSTTERRWIKLVVGNGSPHQTTGYESHEWTLPVVGKALLNGWRRFDILLPDAVDRTWGTLGFAFRKVTVVRMRGNLAISPFQFYEPAVLRPQRAKATHY